MSKFEPTKNHRIKCTCYEPHLYHDSFCAEHGDKRKLKEEDYELICTCYEPHLYKEPSCPYHYSHTDEKRGINI